MYGLVLTLGACTFLPQEWKALFEQDEEEDLTVDGERGGDTVVEPEPEPAATPPPTYDEEGCGTGCPYLTGEYGYVGFAGSGTVDPSADSYVGTDHFVMRQFEDPVDISFDGYITRCEIGWTVAESGPPVEPCESCTWALTVTLAAGAETTANACDSLIDVNDTVASRADYTIGYDPEFEFIDPDGVSSTFPVLMHHDGNEWTAVSDLVAYDPETGAFEYTWLQGIYYF